MSPTDSDVSEDLGDGISFEGDFKMDAGFGFLVAFGYGSEVGLRGEVELGFRKTDIDKLDGASVKFVGAVFRSTMRIDLKTLTSLTSPPEATSVR